jgi:tetratricopeptide (TPR) repeat protein
VIGQVGVCCLLGWLAWCWVLQPARADLAAHRGDRLLDPWQALAEYQSATQLDPGHEQHWCKLARHCQGLAAKAQTAEERADLLAQARDACERAVALVPECAAFRGCLARLLTDLARLKRVEPGCALAEFDRALALDPYHAYLLADAANAALTLSQFDKARAYTERGLACYPTFGVLRAHLGYLAMVEKRYRDAFDQLTMAVQFSEWHGDESGRAFAERMLAVTIRDWHAAAERGVGSTQ